MKMDIDPFDMPRYLSVLAIFSDLSQEERERLAHGCQLKRISRGDSILRTGDACEAFYVVVLGQVKLFVSAQSGQEKIIEIVSPGQSFAEAMMFIGMPCIVNAQALSDAVIVCISKQAVLSEIEQDPRFSMRMLAGISRRLHRLVKDVEGYALHSGMQRLIGYLLRDVEEDAINSNGIVTVSFPVSKATIASRLSLTPEYFSRVLHELEEQGLIDIDKREIRILDVKRLASYGSH